MNKRLTALLILFTMLAAAVVVFVQPNSPSAAEAPRLNRYSYMFFGTFDTAVTLIGFAENQQTFDRAALRTEELFNSLHRQFNQYYPYEGVSNVYHLNRHAMDGPVTVPGELFDLLVWCRDNQPLTRGRVNVALGAVLSLWHTERENADADPLNAKLPDLQDLQDAALHVNMDDLILDEAEHTVFFRDPRLRLDLGAVAKGYAAELAARALFQEGIPHFILNAGGNVRAGLMPMDGRDRWGVAVQDPDAEYLLDPSAGNIGVFYLTDLSVVTSGDYQRYYTVGGKRYHHLISPDTLYPADFMRSVTIITRDSALADLLSTTVFLLPPEEGYRYVLSMEGVDAMWVLNDRSVVMTPGAQALTHPAGAVGK